MCEFLALDNPEVRSIWVLVNILEGATALPRRYALFAKGECLGLGWKGSCDCACNNNVLQRSKDPNNRVLGPKYHQINGIWPLKPDYLSPCTLRG